jgi:hypothetical protein
VISGLISAESTGALPLRVYRERILPLRLHCERPEAIVLIGADIQADGVGAPVTTLPSARYPAPRLAAMRASTGTALPVSSYTSALCFGLCRGVEIGEYSRPARSAP